MKKKGLGAYKQQEKAGVEASDSVQLVGVLFTKLMDNLAKASHHIERKDFSNKSDRLSLSIEILLVLEQSLDFQKGGDLASNLQSLYLYCIRRLTEANASNDLAAISEVVGLLKEIQEAWNYISVPKAAIATVQ
ncbi:flagellar export chaperone FliS [Endozoicomonas sp. 8E]|uniref:flagellar export chaperone FliS n=1 Tax=Endozoicomonas sp. 8E TaxID=3035692 RepID=UPI002939153F|nr:flagellar export chaperone FliS [Endozoicomonas sp. 8E]WOG29100.1 flagellar export chaperone FliS [Endozoicomonas sp. 8E]